MRWHILVPILLSIIETDSVLSGVFGSAIFESGDRDLEVPSLEWARISDSETERFNPIRLQFTIFTRNNADKVAAELRLRRLFHRDVPQRLGGIQLWTQLAGASHPVEGLVDGIKGSTLDFLFTPVRDRYVFEQAS